MVIKNEKDVIHQFLLFVIKSIRMIDASTMLGGCGARTPIVDETADGDDG